MYAFLQEDKNRYMLNAKKVKKTVKPKPKKVYVSPPEYPGLYEFMSSFDDHLPNISSDSNSEKSKTVGKQFLVVKKEISECAPSSSTMEPSKPIENVLNLKSVVNPALTLEDPPITARSISRALSILAEPSLTAEVPPSLVSSTSDEICKEALDLSQKLQIKEIEEKQKLRECGIAQKCETSLEKFGLQLQNTNLKDKLEVRLRRLQESQEEIQAPVKLMQSIGTQTVKEKPTITMCPCGLRMKKCCEMRCKFLETLKLLYIRYPQVQKDIKKAMKEYELLIQQAQPQTQQQKPQLVVQKNVKVIKKDTPIPRQEPPQAQIITARRMNQQQKELVKEIPNLPDVSSNISPKKTLREISGCDRPSKRNANLETKALQKRKNIKNRDEKIKSNLIAKQADILTKVIKPGPSMHEERAKYVNKIVAEYLGGIEKQKLLKLVYKQDENIRAFAYKVVEAG